MAAPYALPQSSVTVNRFQANRIANSTDDMLDCEYIEYSTVPNQPAGVFWAVVASLPSFSKSFFFVLSELSWPMVFFDCSFLALGALGIFQALIGAQILSALFVPHALTTAFPGAGTEKVPDDESFDFSAWRSSEKAGHGYGRQASRFMLRRRRSHSRRCHEQIAARTPSPARSRSHSRDSLRDSNYSHETRSSFAPPMSDYGTINIPDSPLPHQETPVPLPASAALRGTAALKR
ncbi:hypothetical protein GGX14DRAFT_656699 [Mycena pura]|uniref:Uncharacterized protein n=1 Tax=Mycena pura TaxID=153505 RepID=A0AAD6Y9W8_9AGAR|nr:hypothetical protein GGX14DRAFT_656699 [Mycena pura]